MQRSLILPRSVLILIIICLTAAAAELNGVATGSNQIRRSTADSTRYYLVLAGRSEIFYDRSGPTFPILIRTNGTQTIIIYAVGIYVDRGKRIFGRVPASSCRKLMKEPRRPSEVMLRLKITREQYQRGLKILQVWERRIREGALLYPDISMNHLMLVKQVTESLNQDGEKIKLYPLNWGLEDTISGQNPPALVPFLYFKELRRLNESLHVK